jgi:hypothetical protein
VRDRHDNGLGGGHHDWVYAGLAGAAPQ